MFKNILFSISTPQNVYLDKNMSILGGLEAEILTRMWSWSAIFKMATTGVNKMFFLLATKSFFCYQWPSRYTYQHRYSECLWIRS